MQSSLLKAARSFAGSGMIASHICSTGRHMGAAPMPADRNIGLLSAGQPSDASAAQGRPTLSELEYVGALHLQRGAGMRAPHLGCHQALGHAHPARSRPKHSAAQSHCCPAVCSLAVPMPDIISSANLQRWAVCGGWPQHPASRGRGLEAAKRGRARARRAKRDIPCGLLVWRRRILLKSILRIKRHLLLEHTP